jgi:transcription elongation factor Elf1
MTLFKCPECGNETATNATVTSLNIAPTLYCYHASPGDDDSAFEMEVISEAELDTDQESVHRLEAIEE